MEVGTRDPPSSTFEIQPRAQRGRRKRRSDPKQVESANAESRGLAEARGVPTEEQLARMETIFSGTVPQYEYKNHTADIIFHAWGNSLKAAFEQVAVCMFSYMTDLNRVEASEYVELSAEGHSLENLLYHFLDELLFHFLTTMHVCKYVEVIVPLLEGENSSTLEPDIRADPTAAISPWTVRMRCYGEPFQSEAEGGRHTQGTEIKAITMHEMRINDNRCKPQEGVDKPEDPFQPTEETSDESMASDFVDLYVLVDI
ncbi:unnamed protein product [Amoebophrya sp. A25]|nr:unnamed protein product [Amoebophrya sp. A25]|eukprot:GSA25T00021594001.1